MSFARRSALPDKRSAPSAALTAPAAGLTAPVAALAVRLGALAVRLGALAVRLGALARRRSVRGAVIGVVVLAAVSTFGMIASSGYEARQPRLLSGAAWVASSTVGQLTLVDGASAEVAAQVQLAPGGDALDVVQQGADAFAVDRTSSAIHRVDGATFGITSQVRPIVDAGAGLRTLVGPGTLYLVDTARGLVADTDPGTLTNRGALVQLAPQLTPQTASVDSAGRLWVLDNTNGDLVRLDHGRRSVTELAAVPGGDSVLTLAGDAPVLVDPQARTATVIDPAGGTTGRSTPIDLRADDRIQVGGSAHTSKLYLVTSRGVLVVCDLTGSGCGSAIPVGPAGADLGAPIEAGGRIFVPDYDTGEVLVVDLAGGKVAAKPKVLDAKTRFQLLTRDGVVFFNDPNSERAGVIRIDGSVRVVRKYDPADPSRGVSPGGTTSASPSQPEVPPTPPTTPPGTPPSTPPHRDATVQIVLSNRRPWVGETLVLKSLTEGGRPSAVQWTFGDSGAAGGELVRHQWASPGTYRVTVRATFPDGRSASASATVQVAAAPQLTTRVEGSGTVTGNGIACPPACTVGARPGPAQQITLTAKAAGGSVFAGWSGACAGTNTTCTVTLDGGRDVTATFKPGTTQPTTLPAPAQKSPADGASFTNYPRDTTLTWQAVPGATQYLVEVQCDTCGSSPWVPWVTKTVTGTSYSFVWVGDNVGRWRVTAIAADGTKGTSSGFWTFKYHTAPQTLPAPVLLSPANNAVFSNFPRTTTLRWQPVTGATQYLLEIQCDVCGSSMWTPYATKTLSQTSYTFDWVGAQSGRWRVTAITSGGTKGTASGFFTFRYTV